MNKKVVLLALVIVAALGSIYFTTSRRMPEPNRQPYKALGKRMAEEALKLLGDGKKVVVMINREFGAFKIPNLEIQMEAFTNALKQKGVEVDLEKVEMLRVGFAKAPAFAAAFDSVKHSEVAVSLVGFPLPPGQAPAVFKDHKTKFIVVAPYEPGLKPLLQDGIIQLAILPRFPAGNAPFPQNFDNGFQVWTPTEAANLP